MVWCGEIGHVTSRRGQDMYLYMHDGHEERSRDQFEIPFLHQGALVDFLAKKRELTKKTFTTPLTSPNPNIYVKLHFSFKNND